jgi:hypothetical protein
MTGSGIVFSGAAVGPYSAAGALSGSSSCDRSGSASFAGVMNDIQTM